MWIKSKTCQIHWEIIVAVFSIFLMYYKGCLKLFPKCQGIYWFWPCHAGSATSMPCERDNSKTNAHNFVKLCRSFDYSCLTERSTEVNLLALKFAVISKPIIHREKPRTFLTLIGLLLCKIKNHILGHMTLKFTWPFGNVHLSSLRNHNK